MTSALDVSVAVLETRLGALEEHLSERHTALQRQLELRDEALQASLARLHEALLPLADRVSRLERFQAKALGIFAAASAAVPVVGWMLEKVVVK